MPAPRTQVQRRPVHGVLLFDKPLGCSSNQALQKVKWLLRAEKAGHTGTLDPLASGVLPICFGAATKFSQMQLDADKVYATTLRLGSKTSTGDAEGEVIARRAVHVTMAQVEAVIQRFTGRISQLPPMHSALKKDGKALYEYARAGLEVERPQRQVTIHSLRLLQARLEQAEAAELDLEVACSKGTYIRTLGEDIGEALGCGAHLAALRRIRTGGFDASQCVSLPALEAMNEEQRMACLLPTEKLLDGFQSVTLDSENAARFLSGLQRRGNWPDAAAVAVFATQPRVLLGNAHSFLGNAHSFLGNAHAFLGSAHAFLGSAQVTAGALIPTRLLSPLEVSQSLAQQQVNNQLMNV